MCICVFCMHVCACICVYSSAYPVYMFLSMCVDVGRFVSSRFSLCVYVYLCICVYVFVFV